MWDPVGGAEAPVAIDEAGIDVVRALDAADGLQADARALVRQDVHQAVLELVARQAGGDEARSVCLGAGEPLWGGRRGDWSG